MVELSLHNVEGKEIGEISLKDNIFNAKINKYLVHQVVKRYLAGKRRGTASTKNRSEVREELNPGDRKELEGLEQVLTALLFG